MWGEGEENVTRKGEGENGFGEDQINWQSIGEESPNPQQSWKYENQSPEVFYP